MIGKLKGLYKGMDGEWIITLSTTLDPRKLFDSLHDKVVNFEIKQYRKHRSLDANAMAWVLIDKIAENTGETKIAVYQKVIREIGGVSDKVCVQDRAVERLVSGWLNNGIGWQADIEPSKLPGCKTVTLYYGSSVYDTKQMSQLINGLIQEAENLGIPTISDKEAERLIGGWAKKKGENENGTGLLEHSQQARES